MHTATPQITASLAPYRSKGATVNIDNKELVYTCTVVSPTARRLDLPITLRLYMGRSRNASTVYAAVYIRNESGTISRYGYGHAGGYGYCKQSTAAALAIEDAGIKLDSDIAGRGMTSVERALLAVAEAVGFDAGKSIAVVG